MFSRSNALTAVGVLGISLAVFFGADLLPNQLGFEKTVSLPVEGESSASEDLVPIPFIPAGHDSALKGSLVKIVEYSTGSGIVLYRVKFTDRASEILKERDGIKTNLFLVDTRDAATFSGSAKLPYEPRIALTVVNADGSLATNPEKVDIYGYQYSDADSTLEKAAASGAPFNQRFPGFFFRSRQSTVLHGAELDAFATTNGIKWFRMDTAPEATSVSDPTTRAVRLKPDTLTLLVVSNNVKIDVAPSPFCGNGFIQGAEQCDQGNSVNGDGCSNACTVEANFTCSGSPSICGRTPNLFVTKVTTPAENVASHQHLIGQRGASALTLNLRTTNSPAILTQFFFTVDGGTASVNAIDSLDLFIQGQSTPFLTATTARCPSGLVAGTFCAGYSAAGTGLLVTPAQPLNIAVQPVIKNLVSGGGKQFTVTLRSTSVSTTVGSVSAVTAFPVGSSQPLFFNNGNGTPEGETFIGVPSTSPAANVQISGSAQQIVSAKVATLANGGSAGASGSSLPIGPGTPIADFALSLTSESVDAQFRPSTVIFDVQSNNASLKTFTMTWRVDASKVSTSCIARNTSNAALTEATGNYFVVCTLTSGAGPLFLSDGQTGNIILKANTQTVASNPAKVPKLRVSLSGFGNIAATQVGIDATKSHFQHADLRSPTTAIFWMELPISTVSSTQFVGPFCSNSLIEAPEECDDGNVVSGDRCSSLCTIERCGDSFLDANGGDNIVGTSDDEQCDDGNTIDDDDCSNACRSNIQLPLGL